MKETLYMEFDLNVQVNHTRILLKDVAKLACRDENVLRRCQDFFVITIPEEKEGRYVLHVTDLIQKLSEKEKSLHFETAGEPAFIITYKKKKRESGLLEAIKVSAICVVTFFGMAFSIMTFNNDVDVGRLFSQIYEKIMRKPSTGFTVLEITYSIGIGIGVIVFFNHFGKRKLTEDPTPMEVQMNLYEEDIDRTVIDQNG